VQDAGDGGGEGYGVTAEEAGERGRWGGRGGGSGGGGSVGGVDRRVVVDRRIVVAVVAVAGLPVLGGPCAT
jgi:hypothetical protein